MFCEWKLSFYADDQISSVHLLMNRWLIGLKQAIHDKFVQFGEFVECDL